MHLGSELPELVGFVDWDLNFHSFYDMFHINAEKFSMESGN